VNTQITLILAAALALFPLGTGCSKEDSAPKKPLKSAYKDIEKPFDKSEPPSAERKVVAGVDLSELDKGLVVRFDYLVDKLPSPCGKAHSLRTSRNTDTSCKRAPFAVEYVFELLKDGGPDDTIKELYALRFREQKKVVFKHDDQAPHTGPTDASVKVV